MATMIYNVEDKPSWGKTFIFAFQQLLSIMAATIAVTIIAGFGDHMNAAIMGAGFGTLAYILITKKKSPVILSSNFAFIGALAMAHLNYGFLGIMLGGLFTGLVYVILSIIIKMVGTAWIDKLLPAIIIGPVVALIGLTLAPNAVHNLTTANGYYYVESAAGATVYPFNLLALLCGLVTFFIIIICSSQRRSKNIQMTPFLFGILAGYLLASIFSIFGYTMDIPYMKIIDYSPLIDNFSSIKFTSFLDYPRFTIYEVINEIATNNVSLTGIGVAEIALAFIPVSIVSFSEHIADHKNLGSIIERDLLNGEPGLSRTLMGNGVGTIAGTFLGACPITTYGESVGCVAITKNASIRTIIVTAIMCIALSFVTPLIRVLQTIPNCVMGGICLALYGFIASSGLKMLNGIDISGGKNLYTVSVILVAGIGALALQIPYEFALLEPGSNLYVAAKFIEISPIAFALILGIITYRLANRIERYYDKKENKSNEDQQ